MISATANLWERDFHTDLWDYTPYFVADIFVSDFVVGNNEDYETMAINVSDELAIGNNILILRYIE